MPTNTMVENIVAIELAYVNTRHPDFYKGKAHHTTTVHLKCILLIPQIWPTSAAC